ncbi:MAG: hypothetical protein DRJ67_11635 [Thermoprotei archaeon]|nr:MAG: hypothetical protein DRJ67_11635 [Thermoprotei archaeon]
MQAKVTVDYTPIFVDVEKPEPSLRRWDCVVADAQLLFFRDECFDAMVASRVIEHLESPQLFIREYWRVLGSGGTLDLYLLNYLSVNARRNPTHKHIFNALRFALVSRRQGFEVCFRYSAGSLLPGLVRKALTIDMNIAAEETCLMDV